MGFAIAALSRECGVSGPSCGIEYQGETDALRWADGQAGHPWDFLTVIVYEDREEFESNGDPSQMFVIDLIDKTTAYV